MPSEQYEHVSVPGEGVQPDADDTATAAAGGHRPAGNARSGGSRDRRPPGAFGRGRARFRAWRRSRPFWGGLLLILAGLELLEIPLLSLLIHTSIKVVIYIGIGGVFGIIFGALLVACGLLAWFHPVQRVFYAVVGVLLALSSFVVTNLGGFFLGMLLGVIGASLVFGWAPAQPSGSGRRRHRRAPQEPGEGLDGVPGDRPAGRRPGRSRLLALPAAPILMLGLAGTGQVPAATAQSNCLIPLLSLLCPSSSPSSSPSAAASASPSAAAGAAAASPTASPSASAASPPASPSASATPPATAAPSPSVSPDPAASPPGTASAAPSPSKRANPNANKKAAAASLVASGEPATLTAGSAQMQGLAYDGVASVPTGSGTQQMLKFSMTSLQLAGGLQLSVTDGAHTMVTRNTSATFTGNVVLYATKLCGDLAGIPLCFTPQSPPPLVLPIMSFTNVQTEQPLTIADSLAAPGLDITG